MVLERNLPKIKWVIPDKIDLSEMELKYTSTGVPYGYLEVSGEGDAICFEITLDENNKYEDEVWNYVMGSIGLTIARRFTNETRLMHFGCDSLPGNLDFQKFKGYKRYSAFRKYIEKCYFASKESIIRGGKRSSFIMFANPEYEYLCEMYGKRAVGYENLHEEDPEVEIYGDIPEEVFETVCKYAFENIFKIS